MTRRSRRRVGRAVVHQDHLEWGVRLAENRVQRLAQVRLAVEDRDDDGHTVGPPRERAWYHRGGVRGSWSTSVPARVRHLAHEPIIRTARNAARLERTKRSSRDAPAYPTYDRLHEVRYVGAIRTPRAGARLLEPAILSPDALRRDAAPVDPTRLDTDRNDNAHPAIRYGPARGSALRCEPKPGPTPSARALCAAADAALPERRPRLDDVDGIDEPRLQALRDLAQRTSVIAPTPRQDVGIAVLPSECACQAPSQSSCAPRKTLIASSDAGTPCCSSSVEREDVFDVVLGCLRPAGRAK